MFFCSLQLESPQYSLPSGFYWPGTKLGKQWSELVMRLSCVTQAVFFFSWHDHGSAVVLMAMIVPQGA